MLRTLQAPGPASAGSEEGDLRYFAQRRFGPQWRSVLLALAAELFENFQVEEARGFFRQIGIRVSQESALPTVATVQELEQVLNATLAELDWGYATLTVREGDIAIRHRAWPGQGLDHPAAGAWRRAFAALLEGVYTVWLQQQGGRADMAAKHNDDPSGDVLEFSYGI